jgi:hypothetical protein
VLGYRGEMSDDHLRATIRVALAARGLEFDLDHYSSELAKQRDNGCQLRTEILAASLRTPDVRRFEELDPAFWRRIPVTVDFGFRQASVLQSLIGAATQWEREAAVLGGAFNLAITLIDYLVDELGLGTRVFGLLSKQMVYGMFSAPRQAQQKLAETANGGASLPEQFLFGLLAYCCASGFQLVSKTGNQDAWEDLGRIVGQLLIAEAEVASVTWPTRAEARRLLPSVEAKSCLPSVATLHIARLAYSAAASKLSDEMLAAATQLGNVVWRIDDLVDLLKDLRTGTPNSVLLGLADRLADEGRRLATDKDIYDQVDACAEELAPLLVRGEMEGNTEAGELFRFGQLAVAGWTAWFELADSPRLGAGKVAAGGTSARALTFLLAQQAAEYREAIHHLHFPRLLDEGVRYETRPAILSFRAVILDALLDAAESGLEFPRRILAQDVMAILRCKHREVRGGWSYIQEAPELPPDADDLGQVLQVLMRYGGKPLAAICEEAIRLVLDSADKDGGFCTWILEPGGDSLADERIRRYLGIMGGWGVHPEVVCNLLYGLLLYDPLRYQDALHRAVAYVGKTQDWSGAWLSKWYTGPFYGTWRAVSVLGRLAPAHEALTGARRFLLRSQQGNGGWGENGAEPLSTALAMLALGANGRETDRAVGTGAEYLLQTQLSDGSWRACPWISFPTTDGPVVHGSASSTTAFCLKALLASRMSRTA